MKLEFKKEKAKELLELTESIAKVIEQEEPDTECLYQFLNKRQDIIDVLNEEDEITDNELQDMFKTIYELDLRNASQIRQLLDNYSQTLISTANLKKQISYFPKSDNSEGMFIDKRN